jgi:hypothetical protein
MHPVNKLSMETHVAVVRLEELPVGFRVLSAEAALIDSLPENQSKIIREVILSAQNIQPDVVYCGVMCEVQAIDAIKSCNIHTGYGVGSYFNLAAVQEEAAAESGRQAELIKMLNKEEI